MHTNRRSLSAGRVVQVLVPFAAIVVGNVASFGWLSFAGALALGWVIGSALLRERVSEMHAPLRRIWFALAVPIVTGLVLIPLLLIEPATYILLPALAAGVVAVYLAIGYLMWSLVRLNAAE